MKKTLLLSLAIVTVLVVAIFSCSKQNAEKENVPEKTVKPVVTRSAGVTYTVIDSPHNLNLTITFYDDGTNSLTSSEETTIGTYLHSRFSSYSFSNVTRTSAAFAYDANRMVTEEVTLFGFGEDSQSVVTPVSFVFNGTGNLAGGTLSFGGTATNGTEHSCSGNPCTCCDFLWHEYTGGITGTVKYKRVIGCKCTTTPAACFIIDGKCNHTKTLKAS